MITFQLPVTPLINSLEVAQRLGVKSCYLKYEGINPTKTFKDKQTQYLYNYFYDNNIHHYVHTSTGNSATSLVWGLEQYRKKYDSSFILELFISEYQLPYHNFDFTIEGLKCNVIPGTVEDARIKMNEYIKYTDIYTATDQIMLDANKKAYEELLDQYIEIGIEPSYIIQTISKGYGLLGAYNVLKTYRSNNRIKTLPGIIACQPRLANPVVACYNDGRDTFSSNYICRNTYSSVAHAIRRGNAESYYSSLYSILNNTHGYAFDANNENILQAKEIVNTMTGLSLCNTSATSFASLKNNITSIKDYKNITLVFMVTGSER